jgi:hypothetical protein
MHTNNLECQMDFRITGLSPEPFKALFDLDASALATHGAQRLFADDSSPGYPCRVSLAHAAPGEELVLTSFEHQSANSPYRATGPVFARKAATTAFNAINTIPVPVKVRLLSVRAYDTADLIVEAEVIDGSVVEELIGRLFDRDEVAYLHIHYARRGCYACRVDRVSI